MSRTATDLGTVILAAALAAALAAIVLPAAAQAPGDNSARNGGRPVVGNAPAAAPRERAPPALPGARAEPTAVAPADRNAADLQPTEALFDAINRGDTLAAREAISRGADLSGRNVLGLTPLDLAVDLGRNDITFVLLSMRGSETSGPPASEGQVSGAAAQRQTAAERRAREREAREQRRQELLAARAARSSTGPAQPTGPRLFARDGGVPVPQAGFLGFDPVR